MSMMNFLNIIKHILYIIFKSILNYFKGIGYELFQWSKENYVGIIGFFAVVIGLILLVIIPKIVISIILFIICTLLFLGILSFGIIDEIDSYHKYPYLSITLLSISGILLFIFYLFMLFTFYKLVWL